MTTLVGIQTTKGIVMAADSQITEDNLKTISTGTPKIIHRGKYLLGIVGDTRPGDILTYNWTPPLFRSGIDPIQHMGRKVIPSIIKAFAENGYNWNNNDKDGGFDYLVAFNGNLFHIACDMSFIQSDYGMYGLGTGGQFAMGYLWYHHAEREGDWSFYQAETFARNAIIAASVLDINTGLPVQFVRQEKG